MSRNYTVKQGDCISSIAEDNGLFWETLWNLPENEALRRKRQNPNALLPGDSIVIPDKRPKEESCGTSARHTFRIKGIPVRLNLQLIDDDGKPRAGIPYTLEIDGKTTRGKTPADGFLSEIIRPNARKAKLTLQPAEEPEETYEFDLGHMNPVDDVSGIQGRLKNLGYYEGEVTGEANEQMAEAIRKFQADAGLEETGQVNPALQSALLSRHGG